MRQRLRAVGLLALAIVAITCTDAPTSPNKVKPGSGVANITMSPSFSPEAARIYSGLAAFGFDVTEVHVVLTGPDGSKKDTVIAFPASQSQITIEIPVPSSATDQVFDALIELRNAQHVVLFSGHQTVTARGANLPPQTPPLVIINYTGPGKGTKTVTFSPPDTTVAGTATVAIKAAGVDSAGLPVPDLLVKFAVSDATLAVATSTGDATGTLTGLGKRGVAIVSAVTPLGVTGSSRITFVPPAARVIVISGNGQTGVAGSALAQPFVVEVQATDNLPVPGAAVTFRAVTAGGSVQQTSVVADASGRASTTLTLGSTAGTYTFEAGSGTLAPVAVSATATAAPAAFIAIVSGDAQSDTIGHSLLQPLVVKVTDQFGGAAAGAVVTWTRIAGNGTPSATTTSTAVDGTTSITYLLGPTPSNDTIRASVAGVTNGVLFSAKAVNRGASTIAIVSGGNQAGLPNATLPTPLIARVSDAQNNAIANAIVTWSAVGAGVTFTPVSSATDALGQATTQATLGATPGASTVTATVGTVTATTTLTTTAGGGGGQTTLSIVAGDQQAALAGTAVSVAPSVVLKDGSGNPVANSQIVFTVASGGGTITGGTTTTNVSGVATLGSWTLGTTPGPNTVQATFGSLSVTFTATGTAPVAPNHFVFTQVPTAFVIGAPASTITVRLLDPTSVPVTQSGIVVTLTGLASPGPNFPTLTATTDNTGTATFTEPTYNGAPGSVTLTASATGITSAQVQGISIVAAAANKLLITTQPSATAVNSAAFAQQPAVQLADANGNPVSTAGVVITATLASGPTTPTPVLSNATATTNASGVATFAGMSINGAFGSYTLQFSAPNVTAVVSNAIAIGAGPANTLQLLGGSGQSAPVSTAVTVPPSVKVIDAQSNGVAGVAVTFTSTTSGSTVSNGITTGTSVTVTTNALGIAQLTAWTMSATAGPHALTASATVPNGSPVAFTANATAGGPSKFILVQPLPTQVVVGAAVPPIDIQIADANNNPVAQGNVSVTLSGIVQPSGIAFNSTLQTNAQGIASFTISPYIGTIGSETFTIAGNGFTTVTSTVPVVAGAPSALRITTQPSATAQSGIVLTQQPVVQVIDVGQNPVAAAGVAVAAAASTATLSGTTPLNTNSSGQVAFTNLALTGSAGTHTIVFSSANLTAATSSAITIGAGPAASIAVLAGQGQTASAGGTVPILPSVIVKDAAGNPVAGVDVTFDAVTPGSFIDDVTSKVIATNAQGIAAAQAFWMLSPTVGSNSLTATVTGISGSPVTFTATGTPGSASNLRVVSVVPASITVGQPFPAPVQVQIVDANNNAVAQGGVVITATANVQPSNTTFSLTAPTGSTGIATFNPPPYVGKIGQMVFTLTAPNINTLVVPSINVLTGAASKVVINTQPPATAASGVALTPQPDVQITDIGSNPVNGSATVVATIASGSGTIGGTTTITSNASGLATFSNLSLSGAPGSFTLRFSSGTLTPAVSNAISLGAGGPAAMTITAGNGQVAAAGSVLPIAPAVRVTDGAGTPLAGVNVTFALTSGGGSVVGGVAVTNASGIASVTSWQLGTVAGTNTITASAIGGLTASFTATGVAGPASKLVLTSPPSATASSGVALAQQPAVQRQDQFGNAVQGAGSVVTATVLTGTGTLANATATTNAAGLATFSGLTINGTAGSFTLDFNSPGVTHVASSTITLGGGSAAAIAKSAGDGQTAAVGTNVAIAPSVLVTDGAGNPVAGVSVTFAPTLGGGSTPGGSVLTNASGIATVASWTLGIGTGTNNLTASAGALSTTFTATAVAGPATQLIFVNPPPPTATSGVPLSVQPAVQRKDQFGNNVNGGGILVTASILTGSGTLTNGTATTNAGGLAIFTGVTITGTAGTFTLDFNSAGVTHVASGGIILSGGAPAAMVKSAGDGQTAAAGTNVAIAPSVLVTDGAGNPVAGAQVNFTVTAGNGNRVGSPATTNASGIATIGSWKLGNSVGANSLTADLGALSTTFTATAVAGPAAQLSLVTSPPATAASGVALSPQPSVQRQDNFGNAVAGSGFTITAAVLSGSGTLTNVTATTNAAGLATFSGLTISGPAGPLTLEFTSGSLTHAVSGTITLSGGAPAAVAKSAGDGQTAIVASNVAVDPAVLVTDGAGNPVAGAQVTFTVASGGGSVIGSPATTNASGIASVSSWRLGNIAGANSLTASLGALTTTFTATGVAAPPFALTITTQPTTSTSGLALSPQPVIQVRDQYGNATAASGSVTAVIVSGTGTLNNPTTGIGTGGVATFGALTINGSGTFTLQFQSGSLTPVTSAPITQAAGPAVGIAFSVSPTGGTGGVPFSPAVTVRLVDAQTNTVTSNNTNTVTLSIAAGTGTPGATLAGAGPVTFVNGVATFPAAAIDFGGTNYFLRANTNALTQAGAPIPSTASGTFSIAPGPSQLLSTKPGNRVSVAAVGALNPPPVTRPIFVARNAQGNPAPGLTVSVTAFGRCRLDTGNGLFTTLSFTSDVNGEVTPLVRLPSFAGGSGCLIKASGPTFTTSTDSSQIAVFPVQTSHVWTGAASSVWTNAANWIPVISAPSVPNSTSDNVFIPNYNPQGIPVVPVVSGPKPAMNRLTLDSLAQISLGNIGIDIGSGGVAGWGMTNSGSIHIAATATVNGIFDILDAGQSGVCGTVAAQIISLRDVSANVLNVRCKTNIDTTAVVANTVNVFPNGGQGWLHLTQSRAAMAVSGNANFTGDSLWVSGGVISVAGTANFGGGVVSWSGGTLNASSNAVFASNHAIYNTMQMILQGNVTFGGPSAGDQQLIGGQMTLLGNFTQVTGIIGGPGGLTFHTSNDHASVFAGSTPQTVSFASPGQSKFSVLQLQNTSAGGVQFTTNAQIVNGTMQPRVDIVTGRLQINSGATFTVNSGGMRLGLSTNLNLLGNITGVISCTGRTTNSATITGTGSYNGAAYSAATCTP